MERERIVTVAVDVADRVIVRNDATEENQGCDKHEDRTGEEEEAPRERRTLPRYRRTVIHNRRKNRRKKPGEQRDISKNSHQASRKDPATLDSTCVPRNGWMAW